MYDATTEAARKLWGIDRERHLYSEDEERSPGLYADEKRARPAAVDAKLERAMSEALANGSLRLHVTRPFVLAEETGDVARTGGREQVTPTQGLDVPDRSETARPAAMPSVQAAAAERPSWLDRVTDTTRDLLRRADHVVERWLPSPADTHFQQGATIAFRDHATNTTRMAHVTEARHTRALDVKGWLPTQVVTIREEDANGVTRRRELTPRELRSATVMQSTSSGQATDVPDRREIEARHEPVRHAADPPLRQPGSAWNTTVQQAWPATTVRDRAPDEQRATIAWPVHQPRPLTFRATQTRGVEQGQE